MIDVWRFFWLSRSRVSPSSAVTCTIYMDSSTPPTLAAIMHRQSIQPMKLKIIPMMLRRFLGFFLFLGAGAPGWPVAPAVVFTPSVEIWRCCLGSMGTASFGLYRSVVTRNCTML